MSYTSYLQIVKDINYIEDLSPKNRNYSHFSFEPEEFINAKTIVQLKRIWLDHVKEKYQEAQKGKSGLSRFLHQYPLPFKEFCCLLDLVEDSNERSDFERENMIKEN